MYTKTIPLLPTHFSLDVLITNKEKTAIKFQHKEYGLSKESLKKEGQQVNTVATIDSQKKSKYKGERRICLILEGFKPAIVVHELIHVLWHLSKYSGLDINYNSQEWQALFMEQLYVQIMDKSNYKKY